MPNIKIIYMSDLDGLIAFKPHNGSYWNQPYHLAEDLLFFKKMTLGNTVVMGAKTYEVIGSPLKNRTNVVLSRTSKYPDPVITLTDIDHLLLDSQNDVWVIGGKEIYEQFESKADEIYHTLVDDKFSESQFGEFKYYKPNLSEYTEVERKPFTTVDHITGKTFNGWFIRYVKKNKLIV